MYYIGIDGGGTYSRIIAVDRDMKTIGKHTGYSTNISSNSYEKVLDNIKKLLMEFNHLTNTNLADCSGLCIGSAGIDTAENTQAMEKLLKEIGVACPLKVVNDAELILATETKGTPGVAIISGTGSIGYAIGKEGAKDRAGGWGYLIDDGGSGYWLGMQAIKHALLAYDGRGKNTILTEKIISHFKIKNIENVLNYIYTPNFNKAQIAELALLVKNAAAEGDEIAAILENEAANELFYLAKALITRNELFNHKVVLSGSVILLNDNIRKNFIKLIKKEFSNVDVVPIREKPEMGAIYLAMKLK